ncbi:MAG: GYD domain-containing protein [Thermoflexaceae bacterium]|nr:GYD domain-containing protein [Thermoflexaceae bacterium]
MPHYLIQASITPAAWARLIQDPEDRAEVMRPIIENLGGTLEAYYMAFGESDVVLLAEVPDNVTMAALAMAIAAGGAVTDTRTTVLMTVGEAQEAMRRAGAIRYVAPGARAPAGVA